MTADEAGDKQSDARFSLANERTFLAYIRTSLALLASGVAVDKLSVHPSAARVGGAVLLLLLGVVAALGGYLRWREVEMALRLGRAVHASRLPLALAVGLVILTVAAAVLVAG
jgi:putative membrane protein